MLSSPSLSLTSFSEPETPVNLAFSALRKLKRFQKFDCPELPELIDNFPLASTALTDSDGMVDLLTALSKLTDEIPLDKDYALYPLLSEIMYNGLLLARDFAHINSNNRDANIAKITALSAAIKQVTTLAKKPRCDDLQLPGKVREAVENMKNIVDSSWYFFRAEHRTAAGVIGMGGTAVAGTVIVIGGLLIPVNALLAIACIVTGSLASSVSLLLGLQYVRPIDANKFLISERTYELKVAVRKFAHNAISFNTNLKKNPAPAVSLSSDEEHALKEQERRLVNLIEPLSLRNNTMALSSRALTSTSRSQVLGEEKQIQPPALKDCATGFNALRNLKRIKSFDQIEVKTAYANLVNNFQLNINPVIGEVTGVLEQLSELSNTIINNQAAVINPALDKTFHTILYQGLLLAKELSDITVQNRKEKLNALKESIKAVNALSKNPLGQDIDFNNLTAVSVAMKQRVDDASIYLIRYENRIIAGFTSVGGVTVGGVMMVGGILISPFNAVLSAACMTAGALVLSFSLGLALALIRPDADQFKFSCQAYELQNSLLSLKKLHPTKIVVASTQGFTDGLTTDEEALLNNKEAKVSRGYQTYLQNLSALTKDNLVLTSLESPEHYEVINANYAAEFITLLKELKALQTYLTKNSAYKDALNTMLNDATLLTRELGQATNCRVADRKTQIIALADTIHATLGFTTYTSDTNKDDLIKQTLKLRNSVEGSYFYRKENRLVAGIIGAVTTVLSLAAFAASLALLVHFAPLIAPLTFVLAGVTSGVGFTSLSITGAVMLGNSISPSKPLQQDLSKGIYQQATQLTPTIFNKNKEAKVEAKQPSYVRRPRIAPVF